LLPLTWRHRHRALDLWIQGDGISYRPNGRPRAGHKSEHGDRTDEPITSRRKLCEEEVATLLATEATRTSGESLGNVSIANGGAL
jgi:hypothetical protein